MLKRPPKPNEIEAGVMLLETLQGLLLESMQVAMAKLADLEASEHEVMSVAIREIGEEFARRCRETSDLVSADYARLEGKSGSA